MLGQSALVEHLWLAGRGEHEGRQRGNCTGSNLEGSSVFALKFGTEEFALGGRLEVVVVSKGAVVGEGDAAALLGVVVVPRGV